LNFQSFLLAIFGKGLKIQSIMALPIKLSRRESEIMEIVFALEKATLTEIQARMVNAPTRAALRSLLTILENKGHLRHEKAGREFLYAAVEAKRGAGRSALRRVLDVFFKGSLGEAMAAHFSNPKERISVEEIAELESLLQTAKATKPTAAQKSKR
jgi:BlaI family transcriptional regulator, penicillinase repressor